MVTEEDAEKANDFIRDNAENLGKAKAARVYLEDFRKSKKALLFAKKSGTVAERENYAYAHAEYQDLIMGLKEAVQAEESKGVGFGLSVGTKAEDITVRERVWQTMENAKFSRVSYILSYFLLVVILLSVVVMCVETMPVVAADAESGASIYLLGRGENASELRPADSFVDYTCRAVDTAGIANNAFCLEHQLDMAERNADLAVVVADSATSAE